MIRPKLYRPVQTLVRPVDPRVDEVLRSMGSSRGGLPDGLLDTRSLVGNASRRQVLKGMGTAAALGLLPVGTAGCSEEDYLSAIAVAKAIFRIVEEIVGTFRVINDSDRNLNLSVLTDLLQNETIVDGVECIVDVASRAGTVNVDWCNGLLAGDTGEHLAQGTEGGNDPVKTSPFQVTDE